MERYLTRRNTLRNRQMAVAAVCDHLGAEALEDPFVSYAGKRFFVRASQKEDAIMIADEQHPNFGDDPRHHEADGFLLFRDMLDGRCTIYRVGIEAAFAAKGPKHDLAWTELREIKEQAWTFPNDRW